MEIPHTKTITSSWLDAKRVKMAEKLQKRGKEVLKRVVKQRKGKVSKTARILSENGRLETFAKNGEFSDQNGRIGISGISQRMTLCMLEPTYSRLLFGL